MHYFDLPLEIRQQIMTFYFDAEARDSKHRRLFRMVSRRFDSDLFSVLIRFDVSRFIWLFRGPKMGLGNTWVRCILEYQLQAQSEPTPIVKHLRAVGMRYIDCCQVLGMETFFDNVWHHLSSLYIQKMAWTDETSFVTILQRLNIQSDSHSQNLDALALAAFLGHVEVLPDIDPVHWSQKCLLGPPLVSATLGKQFETVKNVLRFGLHSADQVPPLIVAAWQGDVQLLRLLLQHGANVNEIYENKHTPLNVACMKGRLLCAELLLKGGADVNQLPTERSMFSALNRAALFKHPQVVRMLLEAGANVNGIKDCPPIECAARVADEESLRILFEYGADPSSEERFFGTALTSVACKGWRNTNDHGISLSKLLLDLGSDINFGETKLRPLQAAARWGNDALLNFLLDSGAQIDCEGSKFDPPLTWAVRTSKFSAVKLLLERGANVNAHRKHSSTAIYFAARSERPSEEIVELLLRAGANRSINDLSGGPPVVVAAGRGNEGIVRLLLEQGVDLSVCDMFGGTALYRAALSGEERIVKMLIEAGADVNVRGGRYQSILRGAAYLGHKGVMELLLSAGADLDRTANELFDPSAIRLTQEQIARGEQLIQFFLSQKRASQEA